MKMLKVVFHEHINNIFIALFSIFRTMWDYKLYCFSNGELYQHVTISLHTYYESIIICV